MCSDLISPPGTSARSSSTDSTPSLASRCARVQPIRPAPTIRTRDKPGLLQRTPPRPPERTLVRQRAPELEAELLERLEDRPQSQVVVARARAASISPRTALRTPHEAGPERPGIALREPGAAGPVGSASDGRRRR